MLSKVTKVIPVPILESFESFLLAKYSRTKKFLNKADPKLLDEISKKKAISAFKEAVKTTPSYQQFLRKKKIDPQNIKTIYDFDKLVPHTDKENYIKKYAMEKRCKHGSFPKHGNVDESGGTSGVATNWVHDINEENLLFKSLKFEFNYAFEGDKKDFFVISAWSTGPWATGIKFCTMMEKIALVKNTSTDPVDLANTLKMFGTKRNYLIGGYPPFLKNLIEETQNHIDWKKYKIDIVTGGEGVPLEWVYYVKDKLRKGAKIISSYGASDVDIGIGFETPICFYIREILAKHDSLRQELFGDDDIPMVFQYNPTVHYIKNIIGKNNKSEFEITLLDKQAAVPKIKYNLHDEGKRFNFPDLINKIEKYEKGFMNNLLKKTTIKEILKLPFLVILGRTDGTLSFDGANVFPDQIEGGIISNKNVAKLINRFKMQKKYDKKHNVEFHVHMELKKGKKITNELKKSCFKIILEELLKVNPDYKESYTKNNTLKPRINLYPFDHPLFQQDDGKVKNQYIMK
jgi:phenylacetate-CoA ligase